MTSIRSYQCCLNVSMTKSKQTRLIYHFYTFGAESLNDILFTIMSLQQWQEIIHANMYLFSSCMELEKSHLLIRALIV